VDVLSTAQNTLVQLLQDNGDTIWPSKSLVSKDLPVAEQQFQGNWIALGANVTDSTAPTLVSSTPAHNASNAAINSDLVLQFSEAIKAGSGSFVLKKVSDHSTVETFAASSVSIAYNTITLNPSADLAYSTAYYLEAANDVLTDMAAKVWTGLSGASAYTFTTAAYVPPPSVLISEVNATGGDLFELYNYGTTAIDLTGWKWIDSAATTTGAIAFPAMTLAAGARLLMVASTVAFLTAWNLPTTASVIATGSNPGLGSGDAVVVFDSASKVVAAFNYKTSNITADSTLIAPAVRGDGNAVVAGHAGVAMGTGSGNSISAIWDEQSTSAPKYTFAQAGQRGAFSQATATNGTGSPAVIPAKIHAIQGNAATVTDTTTTFTVEAIVTADYQDAASSIKGFFIQEEDTDADADPATSEAIFVYCNTCATAVNVGDKVQVTGTASDYQGLSQLTTITTTVLSSGNTLPAVTTVTFPVPSGYASKDAYLEPFEGMLVKIDGTLTVTENYQLGRFGQVTLAAGGRLSQFTHANAPSISGYSAHLDTVARQTIILDDHTNAQNPDPVIFPQSNLSASNSLRSGSTTNNLTGVLHYSWGGNASSPNAWRIRPTGTVTFNQAERPTTPPSIGTPNVKVASFNLLNYFNTFDGLPDTVDNCNNGVGGTATDCRGADDATEFTRQKGKHKQVFSSLNADVIGLMELENDGYGATSAQKDLLNLINSTGLSGRNYKMIDADTALNATNVMGTDAIKVGLIYDDTTLDLVVGSVKTSGNAIFDRQPLAATFVHTATGEKFTVVVNHLKSKGSAGSLSGDTDQGDGQGMSNVTRVAQAQALVTFLGTLSDDEDILVIGDMNAYAQENPISTIKAAGYTDLLGVNKYSYVFDGQVGYLDHALANTSLVAQVTGADDWHINADEPSVLDYNTNFKSAEQITSLYNTGVYRSSDHDPVLIGLNLVARYNLTLSKIGNGTVSSSGTPVGVSCGAGCLSYAAATTVTLTATVGVGWVSVVTQQFIKVFVGLRRKKPRRNPTYAALSVTSEYGPDLPKGLHCGLVAKLGFLRLMPTVVLTLTYQCSLHNQILFLG